MGNKIVELCLSFKKLSYLIYREINNIREYTISMLVNVVDRLGTVADKLIETADKQVVETEAVEASVSSLQQVDSHFLLLLFPS